MMFKKCLKCNIYKKINDFHKYKKILQYDLDGNFIKEWDSVLEASQVLNINKRNLYSCLSNYNKTANGFVWKYKEKIK